MRRLLLVFAAAVGALTLVAALAVVFGIWPHFVALEQREAEHQQNTALRAVRAEQGRLNDLANTYGVWDEPYDYLHGANPAFAARDLSAAALDQIDVDAALLFTRSGRIVFRGLRRESFREAMPAVERALAAAPALTLGASHALRTALVSADGRVVIVSVRRVVRTEGTGQSPGAIALVREVSPGVLARMADLAGVHFYLLPAARELAAAPKVRAQAPVVDAWGRPSIMLQVLGKPELLHLGRTTIIGLALAMLAALGALSAAFAYALAAAVIRPVRALSRKVSAISRGEAPAPPRRTPPAEIAELAAAFDVAFAESQREAALHKLAREEAQAARAAAEKNAEAKSRFLATMSHELRTPLNAVIGYTEMLQESALAEGRAEESADCARVLSAAYALHTLINSILDFTRLETGRMPVFAEDFSVGDLAGSVADAARPALAQKGLDFVVDVPADIGAAVSDPGRISQCLLNVLSNAAKFTATGAVVFRARRRRVVGGDWILFTVEDTGIGMSPQQLERVFEPFMQADESIARRFGGAGLGLTITRELLSRLGGRISISSDAGLGARVLVEIPARLPEVSAPIALKSAA